MQDKISIQIQENIEELYTEVVLAKVISTQSSVNINDESYKKIKLQIIDIIQVSINDTAQKLINKNKQLQNIIDTLKQSKTNVEIDLYSVKKENEANKQKLANIEIIQAENSQRNIEINNRYIILKNKVYQLEANEHKMQHLIFNLQKEKKLYEQKDIKLTEQLKKIAIAQEDLNIFFIKNNKIEKELENKKQQIKQQEENLIQIYQKVKQTLSKADIIKAIDDGLFIPHNNGLLKQKIQDFEKQKTIWYNAKQNELNKQKSEIEIEIENRKNKIIQQEESLIQIYKTIKQALSKTDILKAINDGLLIPQNDELLKQKIQDFEKQKSIWYNAKQNELNKQKSEIENKLVILQNRNINLKNRIKHLEEEQISFDKRKKILHQLEKELEKREKELEKNEDIQNIQALKNVQISQLEKRLQQTNDENENLKAQVKSLEKLLLGLTKKR